MVFIYILAIITISIYCFKLRKFGENFSFPPFISPKYNNVVPISVIVAVKNGADSLLNLVECLKNQSYSGEIEFIIIDDQSEDNSATVIQNIAKEDPRFKFASSIDGDESLSFKKKALDAGIKISSHEWLLFTDVDCRPPETWVQEMAEYFTDESDYVIGVSTVITNTTNVSLFQSIDFQMLMGATIAQCNIGKPWACSGQNQAYRKSLFQKVEGFKHISNLLQGDDTVFMQLCRYADAKIVGALTENAVISRTESSWWSFLKQRMRWAGDSKYMLKLCPEFFVMSAITFLANLSLLILIITSLSPIIFLLIFIKFYHEANLHTSLENSSILKEKHDGQLLIWAVLQIPYIVLMGLMSFWAHQLFGWSKSKN